MSCRTPRGGKFIFADEGELNRKGVIYKSGLEKEFVWRI